MCLNLIFFDFIELRFHLLSSLLFSMTELFNGIRPAPRLPKLEVVCISIDMSYLCLQNFPHSLPLSQTTGLSVLVINPYYVTTAQFRSIKSFTQVVLSRVKCDQYLSGRTIRANLLRPLAASRSFDDFRRGSRLLRAEQRQGQLRRLGRILICFAPLLHLAQLLCALAD